MIVTPGLGTAEAGSIREMASSRVRPDTSTGAGVHAREDPAGVRLLVGEVA
jgi:hypothetical protein